MGHRSRLGEPTDRTRPHIGRSARRSRDGRTVKREANRRPLRDDVFMYPRPMTAREYAVLTALLSVDFDGVERLRAQAAEAQVFGGCACGCPSIDFFQGRNSGMNVVVNAGVRDSDTYDGLFLYTVDIPGTGEVLGGIEWVGQSESDPDELPTPADLTITLATP